MTIYIALGLAAAVCFVVGLRWPQFAIFCAVNSYVVRSVAPSSVLGLPAASVENAIAVGLPCTVLGAVFLRGLIQHRAVVFRVSSVDMLVVFGVPMLLFGSIYAPNPDFGMEVALRYLALCVAYYFAVRVLAAQSNYRVLIRSFSEAWFVGATIVASLSLALPSLTTSGRLTLGTAHPIPFSLMLAVGILVGLHLLQESLHAIQRLVYAGGGALLVVQFLSTNTRGTFLSLLLSLLVVTTITLLPKGKGLRPSRLFGALALATLAFGLVNLFRPLDIQRLIAGLVRLTTGDVGASASERIEAFSAAIQLGYSNPLLGIGSGGFKAFGKLDYVHNLFLEMFAENGIVGVVWILLLVANAIALMIRGLRVSRSSSTQASVLIAVALFVLHLSEAQVSFTLWMHKGLFIALALLVACIDSSRDVAPEHTDVRHNRALQSLQIAGNASRNRWSYRK